MRVKITVKCKWNLIVKCKWGLIVYHALVTGILLGNTPQHSLGSGDTTSIEVQGGLAPTNAVLVYVKWVGHFFQEWVLLFYVVGNLFKAKPLRAGYSHRKHQESVSLRDRCEQSVAPRLMHYFMRTILLVL